MICFSSLACTICAGKLQTTHCTQIIVKSSVQAIPGEAGLFRQARLVRELHQNAQATFVHNFSLAPLAYLQD